MSEAFFTFWLFLLNAASVPCGLFQMIHDNLRLGDYFQCAQSAKMK